MSAAQYLSWFWSEPHQTNDDTLHNRHVMRCGGVVCGLCATMCVQYLILIAFYFVRTFQSVRRWSKGFNFNLLSTPARTWPHWTHHRPPPKKHKTEEEYEADDYVYVECRRHSPLGIRNSCKHFPFFPSFDVIRYNFFFHFFSLSLLLPKTRVSCG